MMEPPKEDDLLEAQIEYYRARAPEYDAWFLRRGRYDRGPEENAAWFRDVARAREWVDAWIPPGAELLELAAGTGLWTERLAARAGRVTAVDASPEALACNRARLDAARGTASHAPVEYLEAGSRVSRPRGNGRVPRLPVRPHVDRSRSPARGRGRSYGASQARRRPDVPDRQGVLPGR